MPWQTTFYIFAALPLIPLVMLLWLPDDPRLRPACRLELERWSGTLSNELDALLREACAHVLADDLKLPRVVIDYGPGRDRRLLWAITFGPVYLVRIRHFPATDMSYVLSGGALVGAVFAILFAITPTAANGAPGMASGFSSPRRSFDCGTLPFEHGGCRGRLGAGERERDAFAGV